VFCFFGVSIPSIFRKPPMEWLLFNTARQAPPVHRSLPKEKQASLSSLPAYILFNV
jgi:hypothetical protein